VSVSFCKHDGAVSTSRTFVRKDPNGDLVYLVVKYCFQCGTVLGQDFEYVKGQQ
jgi:hypothetical protein